MERERSRRAHIAISLRALLVASLIAVFTIGPLGAVWDASAASSSPYFTELPDAGDTELQEPRLDAVAAPLPDGQVLIVGGEFEGTALKTAELFTPATDSFTKLAAELGSAAPTRWPRPCPMGKS